MGVIVAVGIAPTEYLNKLFIFDPACDDTNCGACITDEAICTECNDGFGLDGATCAGKFLILRNDLLPTLYFNVVIL